jgi:ribosome-binding protein aMBF1 (putative translation factor)
MAFGNLVAFATRQAVEEFKRRYYRQTTTWNRPSISVVSPVPEDFAQRLIHLRGRLRLSQQELAVRLGVAGRAIVYQWESERRRPSPVFWKKVESLEASVSAEARVDRELAFSLDARPSSQRSGLGREA